jgi:hypothetical protein
MMSVDNHDENLDSSASGMPEAKLALDTKVVTKDHKPYLILKHQELELLSEHELEAAHLAYLDLKPRLDALKITESLKKKPSPQQQPTSSYFKAASPELKPVPKPKPVVIQDASPTVMPAAAQRKMEPTPPTPLDIKRKLAKKEASDTELNRVNDQKVIRPGVPLSPVLNQALLRYNNGANAQNIKRLNPTARNADITPVPTSSTAPTPLNMKPKPKPQGA